MADKEVKIKIFSDTDDYSSVRSAIMQVSLPDIVLIPSVPGALIPEANDILIFNISSTESTLLRSLLKIKNTITNKIILCSSTANALVISSLIKLGFHSIYLLPYELYKFIDYLKEIISNNSYITEDRFHRGFGLSEHSFHSMIGNSEIMKRTISLSRRVAEKSTSNILILGETGVGKGLLARAIHNESKLGGFPFIDIVCTSIPENLLESELFGYEPGAFTNARVRKYGLFELAGKGTLFLDEIGDLSYTMQSKLLRTIEKKIIRRLGGTKDIPIHARIISATNRDLEGMVDKNLFRRDLYHRLNVVAIEIPPLRERVADIITIANHFLKVFSKQFGKRIQKIDLETRQFLTAYQWPGNVRELKNSIERAVLLCDDNKLTMNDFQNLLNSISVNISNSNNDEQIPQQIIRLDLNFTAVDLKKLNRIFAEEVMKKTHGNKSRAAKFLGISRPRLDGLFK
ncbi:MAG: sigma-54-dependent Fis family transcriptional regulator [Ignavibacteriales bacterium]|nr:sigma-54-dependent Fis family transcriptional regulator [Ignavibacteriales bacterium]